MLKGKRLAALALSAALLLGLCAPVRAAEGEKETVIISCAEDLERLGRQCALDTWSQSRRVVLAADLDLTGRDFKPIPTFGGEFDGQGHTISGLCVTGDGSSAGLFRFVQEGAAVRSLTVKGVVAPGGSAGQVGGIAGVNCGAILNCVFQGTVRGESQVGGIAGLNRETGEAAGCAVSGQIIGTSAVGGVAGENRGVLLKCRSSASVNTAGPDTSLSIQELAAGAAIGPLSGEQDDPDRDMLQSGGSDVGGIAGLSRGVVQSCVNLGTVGYPHVGYNIGGVAGRQSGYLSGCSNSGAVYGRKDVGGIVGQAEPDVTLLPGMETLDALRRELDGLDGLITRALNDADAQGDGVSQRLTAMGRHTGEAQEYAKALLDRTSDFADGNIEQINSLSATVTAALDRLSPALEELAAGAGEMEDLCAALDRALDDLTRAGRISQSAGDSARAALDRLRRAGRELEGAAERLGDALEQLQSAVIHKDPEGEKEALEALGRALADLAGSFSQASQAAAELLAALKEGLPPEDGDVEALAAALAAMGEAVRQAGDSLSALGESLELNRDALEGAARDLERAVQGLKDAADSFSAAMEDLGRALLRAEGLSGPLGDALGHLRDGTDAASSLGRRLERAFEEMGRAVDILRDGPVELLPLGEEFRAAGDGLYGAVSGLSGEMEGLHSQLDQARGTLSGDLRAVSSQMSIVSGLMLDAMEEAIDGIQNPEVVSDRSDQDFEAVRQGKIAQCVNTGPVDGDRNVGGIAGCVSIEYDLDPEDDVQRFSPGSTYETRAVLLENVNQGSVTAKKDCAGGAAGRMDLGTAVRCQNYGGVASTSGSYVGGVAGWSQAPIRAGFAKCVLSGRRDVGGIAGWADQLYDCRAIVSVEEGDERVGAIAGSAGLEGGRIRNNCFLDTGLAGIDGVSYEGAAQPMDYDGLCAEPDTPAAFLSFALTLRTEEGEVVSVIPLAYGQSLEALALPQPPEREGFYGRWPEFGSSSVCADITLEAVYTPWAALTASQEKEGARSLALAEGQFTEDAVLHVRAGSQPLPAGVPEGAVWEVALTGTSLPSDAQVPLRLLDAQGSGTVWQYADGQWQRAEAEVNGSYLLLTMEGLSGVYCVPSAAQGAPVLLLAGGAAALLAAGIALWMKRKKRTKKSAPAKNPQ